jgi:cyclase
MAAVYDAEGADELTFLDVTASSGGRETIVDVVRRTAEQVFIPLTVGGGIRTPDDVDRMLRAGADKVSVNTAAIARPELLGEMARRFGSQCIVLSVDARTVPAGSPPTPSGWRSPPGGRRGAGIDAVSGRRAARSWAWGILLNSMDADGTRRVRPQDDRGGARRGGRAGDRQRRRRCGGTLAPAVRAGADAVLAAASSTSGCGSGRSRTRCARTT